MKTVNRREVLQLAAFAAGTLLFSDEAGALFHFNDEATADRVRKRLAESVRGEVIAGGLRFKELQTDFGGVISKEPRIVVVPADGEDAGTVLKIAGELQVPVSFRGAGHSCFGQSLSDGGILLLNRSEGQKAISVSDGLVEVATGSYWSELERELNARGMTSPVLTDYLDLTVGGTLSVGGYGLRSFQWGGQVDNVESLDLVLPDGTRKTCSTRENPELFRYALCGLGQLGLISSVRFKPIPYKEKTKVLYFYCPKQEQFMSVIRGLFSGDLSSEFDHFSAYWVHGSFVVEVGKSCNAGEEVDDREIKKRLAGISPNLREKVIDRYHLYIHRAREDWVNRYLHSYRLWEDYIFDLDGLEHFLRRNIAAPGYRNRSILPAVYFLAMDSRKSRDIPFSLTAGRKGEMVVGAGYYYMVPVGREKELEEVKQELKRNMADCLELGGRPYLYGWHDLNPEQKERFYRGDLQELQKLKQKFDPNNIVNPHVFVL